MYCLARSTGRFARFGVEPLQQVRGVVPRFALDLLDQQLFGFVRGQAGDAFELVLLLGDQLLVLWRRPPRSPSRVRRRRGRGLQLLFERDRSPTAARRAPPRAGPASARAPAPAGAPGAPGARRPSGSRAPSPWRRAALPSCGFPRRARRRWTMRRACSSARPMVSAAMRLRLATQTANTPRRRRRSRRHTMTFAKSDNTRDVLSRGPHRAAGSAPRRGAPQREELEGARAKSPALPCGEVDEPA